MKCPNCGNTLEDNAKFCTNCGNPVSATNLNTNQQPVNMTVPVQQPAYNLNPVGDIPKKNNVITIILGVAVAVLLAMLISMQSKVYNLESELSRSQRDLENYKNRNSIEKSIDAIGSWID